MTRVPTEHARAAPGLRRWLPLLVLLGVTALERDAAACSCELTASLILELETDGCWKLDDRVPDVTGTPAIDDLFVETLRFVEVARLADERLALELSALRDDLRVDDDAVDAAEGLGPAVIAALSPALEGELSATVPEGGCPLDGGATLDAAAECQGDAGCALGVPRAELSCGGACSAAGDFPDSLQRCEAALVCNLGALARANMDATCRTPLVALDATVLPTLDAEQAAAARRQLDALRARLSVLVATARRAQQALDGSALVREAMERVDEGLLDFVTTAEGISYVTKVRTTFCAFSGVDEALLLLDDSDALLRERIAEVDALLAAVGG